MDRKPIQTWTSLHELSEIKKGCYKTYMVTYQFGDWIKAGVHLRAEFMGSGPLPFQTDQILPSMFVTSTESWNKFLKTEKQYLCENYFVCVYIVVYIAILLSCCLCCLRTLSQVSPSLNIFLNVFKRYCELAFKARSLKM